MAHDRWQVGLLSFLGGFLVAYLLLADTSMVRIASPSTIAKEEASDTHTHTHTHTHTERERERDEICTADLLLEHCCASTNDTTLSSSIDDSNINTSTAVQVRTTTTTRTDNETWLWRISNRGQRACGGTRSLVKPLDSTPKDIYEALKDKWVLLIGDSSTRMLHDYLVGRWLGGYTHWPTNLDNHGPKEHTRTCSGAMICHYDVVWGGARLTFVWFSLDLSPKLSNLLKSTVGSPDVVVAQHGYWERESKRDPSVFARTAPQNITDMLDHLEMESLYQQVYNNMPPQKRIWMSLFDSVYGPYDGSKEAKELGWEIFDRTKLASLSSKAVGAHPMAEVLELELELLLVLINETQARNEEMYGDGA